jgi:cell wall-associated NlpC family hydrolase
MFHPEDDETALAGRLIERLLVDPEFRAEFRRDPAGACVAAGLPGLAADLGGSGKAMHTLELRESRSSLAGVVVAVAVEGMSVSEAQALVQHGLPGGLGKALHGVKLPRGVQRAVSPAGLERKVERGLGVRPASVKGLVGSAGAGGGSGAAGGVAGGAGEGSAPGAGGVSGGVASGGGASAGTGSAVMAGSSGGGSVSGVVSSGGLASGGGQVVGGANGVAAASQPGAQHSLGGGAAALASSHLAGGGAGQPSISGRISWFGGPDDPSAGGTPASGIPISHPGIAVYNTHTLGGYWLVKMPNGRQAVLQQTDLGPAPWTGRKIDFTYSALPELGYTEQNFPTDALAHATYLGKSLPSHAGAGVLPVGAQGGQAPSSPDASQGGGGAARAVPAAGGAGVGGAGSGLLPDSQPVSGSGLAAPPVPGAQPVDGGVVPQWPDQVPAGGGAGAVVSQVPAGAVGSVSVPPVGLLGLLDSPRLSASAGVRAWLAGGGVDPRMVSVLDSVLANHSIGIASVESLSAPVHVQALDIVSVDGQPVGADNFAARDLVTEIAALDRSVRPDEIGTPWPIRSPGFFSDASSGGSLHLAFEMPGTDSPPQGYGDVATGSSSLAAGGYPAGTYPAAGYPAAAYPAASAPGSVAVVGQQGEQLGSAGAPLSLGAAADPAATTKVQAMVHMADSLLGKPYIYGGGHGSWSPQPGYDCSGFVSAVLHAGGYLSQPVDTTVLPDQIGIESGPGKLVTIYDRALSGENGHVIICINGQFYESGGMKGPWGGGGGAEKIEKPSAAYLATFPNVLHPKGL